MENASSYFVVQYLLHILIYIGVKLSYWKGNSPFVVLIFFMKEINIFISLSEEKIYKN